MDAHGVVQPLALLRTGIVDLPVFDAADHRP
jgi:hypothetical protein